MNAVLTLSEERPLSEEREGGGILVRRHVTNYLLESCHSRMAICSVNCVNAIKVQGDPHRFLNVLEVRLES